MLEECKSDLNFHLILEKMNKSVLLLQLVPGSSPGQDIFEVVEANSHCAELMKTKREELISRRLSFTEHLNEDSSAQVLQVLQTGETEKFDFFSTERERWYSLSVYCPQESLLAVIIEDITKHKMIEQELEKSEETLRLTLEIAGEGLWQWHYDEDIVYHNKGWSAILGMPEEAGSHQMSDFFKLVHPDDRDRVNAISEEANKNRQPYFSEHRMVLDDGRVIWIVDRGIPVKDKKGRYYRTIGSLTDTTRYRQAQQELYLEKEVIRSTLLSVGDGVISIDNEGSILLFNPAAEALTGWERDEVIGKKIDQFFQLIEPKSGQLINLSNLFKFGFQENKPISDKDKVTSLRVRDGRVIEIYHTVSPIRLPDGQTVGYIVVFTDVSEMVEKQREIQYLSMHDELTGLYNRHYLRDALQRLDVERNLPTTIIIVDINHLKATNDTFGHAAGDSLIQNTADYLTSAFRKEDIIARIGGDEFCILLPKTSEVTAEQIKQRLLMDLALYDAGENKISLSIGYAVKTVKGESIMDIFGQADQDMYRHKETQRSLTGNNASAKY